MQKHAANIWAVKGKKDVLLSVSVGDLNPFAIFSYASERPSVISSKVSSCVFHFSYSARSFIELLYSMILLFKK